MSMSVDAGTGPDAFTLTYSGAAAASGDVALRCNAPFVAFLPGADGVLRVQAERGAWAERETYREQATPGPAGSLIAPTPWQASEGAPEGHVNGTVEILLRPNGGAWAFATDDAMSMAVRGSDAVWTPVSERLRTMQYHEHTTTGLGATHVTWRHPVSDGAVRQVDTSGAAQVTGPMSLLVRDATLRFSDGHRWDLPDHDRTEPRPGGLSERHVRTDGWLYLPAATLTAPNVTVAAHCRDMQQTVQGEATWRRAEGTFLVAGGAHDVPRGLVSVQGSIAFDDHPEAGYASVAGQGTLTWVSEDLVIVQTGRPSPGTALAIVGALVLLGRAIVPVGYLLYTRLKESELLAHPIRRLIMDHIEANPGTNGHAMAQALQRPRSSLRHHLRILVTGGVVVRHRIGGETLLVANHGGMTIGAREALLQAKEPARWLAEATAKGPVPRKALAASMAERFDISDSGARKWIARCQALGILSAEGHGHGVSYRCAL